MSVSIYNFVGGLEVVCPECEGQKKSKDVTWKDCEKCNGIGKLLTPRGRELLEFVARHTQLGISVDRLRVIGCDAPKGECHVGRTEAL